MATEIEIMALRQIESLIESEDGDTNLDEAAGELLVTMPLEAGGPHIDLVIKVEIL